MLQSENAMKRNMNEVIQAVIATASSVCANQTVTDFFIECCISFLSSFAEMRRVYSSFMFLHPLR